MIEVTDIDCEGEQVVTCSYTISYAEDVIDEGDCTGDLFEADYFYYAMASEPIANEDDL